MTYISLWKSTTSIVFLYYWLLVWLHLASKERFFSEGLCFTAPLTLQERNHSGVNLLIDSEGCVLLHFVTLQFLLTQSRNRRRTRSSQLSVNNSGTKRTLHRWTGTFLLLSQLVKVKSNEMVSHCSGATVPVQQNNSYPLQSTKAPAAAAAAVLLCSRVINENG